MSNSLTDWNPGLYLKYRNERIQPAVDLVNRITLANPARIIDIGCGPGNSTEILAARWPMAKILGIDNSEAMIRRARDKYPAIDWRVADASAFNPVEGFDIVFANAVIHWIPNHEKLLSHLFSMTTRNGFLAVQMPMTSEMKIAELIESAFRSASPDRRFDIAKFIHYNPAAFYLKAVSSLTGNFHVWTTTYFHIMDSARDIYEMMGSTRMRPYLDQLQSDQEKTQFEKLLTELIEAAFDRLGGGKIVFPFKRLFLLLQRDKP